MPVAWVVLDEAESELAQFLAYFAMPGQPSSASSLRYGWRHHRRSLFYLAGQVTQDAIESVFA